MSVSVRQHLFVSLWLLLSSLMPVDMAAEAHFEGIETDINDKYRRAKRACYLPPHISITCVFMGTMLCMKLGCESWLNLDLNLFVHASEVAGE